MGGKHNTSPVEIEKNLKGIDFPAHKEDLIQCARSHHASEDVMEVLDKLPDREYGNAADVAKGIGQVL